MQKCLGTLAIVLIICNYMALGFICSRYPPHTLAPKSQVDENFFILIQGNPQTYMHGAEYKINLDAFNGARFVIFMLALENESGDMNYNDDLGKFEILDNVETRYSANCFNMVESTNTNPKTHIEVKWTAPREPGSGCILIRATVLQNRDVWFMDDGGLTRKICEEIVDDVESKTIGEEMIPCCACDEASYEIIFEGTWSRNLHPKDFPPQGWITRFSDIIGASHTSDYRFWEYGQLATEGMKEFAEHGSLRLLQSEFNQHFREDKIRTIIKARGPAFPNLNSQSISSVRVDSQHHMLSLASKIDPSPDWVVGLSGLELCLTNCTWLEEKIINLYPWDIGTDAGPSYMSPDQPQLPPDVIRRIRHDYPNDPRSPFFNEEGEPMKPLAMLTLRRKKLYVKICDEEESRDTELPRECATHPFSAWSECSATCGQGTQWRKRVYKQPEVAKIYNCDELTRNYLERPCFGNNCQYANNNIEKFSRRSDIDTPEEANCELTTWGAWSPCSKTCGEGKMMRRRQYVVSEVEEKCQSQILRKLLEYKKCVGRNCLHQMSIASEEIENNNNNAYSLGNEIESHQQLYNSNSFQNKFSNINKPEEETLIDTLDNMNGEKEENTQIENNEQSMHVEDEEDQQLNTPLDEVYSQNYALFDDRFHRKQEQNNKIQRQEDHFNSNINRGSWRVDKANEILYGNNIGNDDDVEDNNRNIDFEDRDENIVYPIDPERSLISSNNSNNNKWHGRPNKIVDCCFEKLQVYSCADETVTGNFWFYNYCTDECMIYAVVDCDVNRNKFKSLEECLATCQKPEHNKLRRQKQSNECF